MNHNLWIISHFTKKSFQNFRLDLRTMIQFSSNWSIRTVPVLIFNWPISTVKVHIKYLRSYRTDPFKKSGPHKNGSNKTVPVHMNLIHIKLLPTVIHCQFYMNQDSLNGSIFYGPKWFHMEWDSLDRTFLNGLIWRNSLIWTGTVFFNFIFFFFRFFILNSNVIASV